MRLECKQRRKALGVTQVQLASESGIPQANISLFEAGKLDMRCTQVERLFNALDRLEKRKTKRQRPSAASGPAPGGRASK